MKIKKQKARKGVMNRKLKFEDYKDCLEGTQLDNRINQLERIILKWIIFENYQREFIKNNKLILNSLQKFTSEKRDVFTEEINKINSSSNDDTKNQ